MLTGIVGWDATVANPKGATELERIADVTGLPLVDQQQVCAVAFQGRLACFDSARGTLNWSRDVSSLYGLAGRRQVRLRDRRQGRRAGARQDDRRVDVEAGPARRAEDRRRRRSSATCSASSTSKAILHLLSPINGAYVGRLATDGTAATAQPAPFLGSVLWQSAGGNLFAVTAK